LYKIFKENTFDAETEEDSEMQKEDEEYEFTQRQKQANLDQEGNHIT
jgi:hypothetical protein